ncbi:MAG: DUF4836 family protein [Muribaculaceae bacterium]|nr:DUF4836 family protein [Muribaculaceae bacterium]
MKKLYLLVTLLSLLLTTACSNVNENLEQMIPADATGVVSINMPEILKKAQLQDGDRIVLPAGLQAVIDENDAAPLCQLLTDLPVMGIDTKSKAYAFFTLKTFGRVLLVPLADESAAKKTIAQRAGSDFTTVEGLDCIYVEDLFYAINNKTLFIGMVNKALEREKVAHAASIIMQGKSRNITEVNEVKECIDADGAVNAYFQLEGIRALLKRSKTYKDIAQRMPLVEVFTESDIKAVTCAIKMEDDSVSMNTHFIADANSDYLKLMNTMMAKPDAEFLKIIPNSMDYIMAMSVNGEQFTQLAQIKQLLKAFANLPYIGSIDLAKMLATIDGPVAVGLASDPHLEGEWNAVIAARSINPDDIVNTIGKFALALGQAPELYDNEFVYQYDNKMIRVGSTGSVFYLKMLNYEQTEANASDDASLVKVFDENPFAVAMRARVGNDHADLHFGLTDMINGRGLFTTTADMPAALALLQALCGIKGPKAFDDMLEEEDIPTGLGDAIDGFHELN